MKGRKSIRDLIETECKNILKKKIRSRWFCSLGMSIVHEVTLGAHCGLRMLGLALITNKCLSEYDSTVEAVHEDVIRISELKANDLQQLILDFIGIIKTNQI